MPDKETYGLIVGSGMSAFAEDAVSLSVETPLGRPSANLRQASLAEREVFILPRHGDQHDIAPHKVNYRANLLALHQQAVTAVISLNTVGVIPSTPEPGELAVPDQLIDYTWGREHSLRDGGFMPLDHIEFTDPFCPDLRQALLGAAEASGLPCTDGGIYGVTQGPRLETAAEVDRFENDGVAYLGMTAMPEVSLARELGMRVACLSMIVNPAAGRGEGSIHGDIEASIATSRSRAIQLLEAFFAG